MFFLKAVNQEFSYLGSGLMSAGVIDGGTFDDFVSLTNLLYENPENVL